MRVGLWRRVLSLVVDIIPIITVLSICFSLFVGDIIKPENYDEHQESYQAKVQAYNDEVIPYFEQYTEGELTTEEYNEITKPIEESYFDNEETDNEVRSYLTYVGSVIAYFFIGTNLVYFIYSGITKGRTFGRIFAKIELKGKVNWWTLFLREFIWKTLYWSVTFGAGILIDVFMIAFTRKKMAFRDMVSQTRVAYEGIDYPF